MKILVFGNLLIEKDSLPIKLIPRLKQEFPDIRFKEFDPTESLEKEIEKRNLIIIDAVEGTDKVLLLKDIEQLKSGKIYTMHDFDLAYNLKILKRLNLLDTIRIIGVPMGVGEDEAMKQIKKIIICTIKNNKK